MYFSGGDCGLSLFKLITLEADAMECFGVPLKEVFLTRQQQKRASFSLIILIPHLIAPSCHTLLNCQTFQILLRISTAVHVSTMILELTVRLHHMTGLKVSSSHRIGPGVCIRVLSCMS